MNVRPNGFLPIWSPVPGAAPAEFDRTLSSRPFSSTLDRMLSLNHALDQPAGARGRGDHIAAEFSHDLLEVRMPNAKAAHAEDRGELARAGQRIVRSPSRSLKTEI